MKKTIAIVQARMGSTRLPKKVMMPINSVPMIELLLSRLSSSKIIDQVIVATSDHENNKPLLEYVNKLNYKYYVGSEEDVLDRFYQAALEYEADIIVRITADCPLIDPEIVDKVIKLFISNKVDYASNVNPPTFPDGLDVAVCSIKALKEAWQNAQTSYDREHVMPYIQNSKSLNGINFENPTDYSNLRWTVDEPEDFDVVSNVFNYFSPDNSFGWKDVLEIQYSNPEIFHKNQHIKRNDGAKMSNGQKLWARAKNTIPGGNMLLSKRAEMFLPDLWPTYYQKAKGCNIWDLDGNKFVDVSLMGVGTNILGYGHPEVDEAVQKTIKDGNMSTLNCPEEVFLSEKLIELHPWAEMVRLSRTGGEAVAVAVRIARAASRKDKVAICGYHGWHDWYLSANLGNDDDLEAHLLPGLEPNGVPKGLKGSVKTFQYNNFAQLESIVSGGDIGVIIMEVERNHKPVEGFLEKVRKLATEKNIVLIFDECTSGFRQNFGGLHKLYNVEPDIATFGKALGNGYAITAIIGRREVMELAQTSFISSTFWTERIGPSAALKTLEVMEREKSWEIITDIGNEVSKSWKDLAVNNGLDIEISGLPAILGFSFNSSNHQAYKTLITQEMLKKDYLATNSFYSCIDHTKPILDSYFENLEPIFKIIRQCEDGKNVNDLLDGPISHKGFQRLN